MNWFDVSEKFPTVQIKNNGLIAGINALIDVDLKAYPNNWKGIGQFVNFSLPNCLIYELSD